MLPESREFGDRWMLNELWKSRYIWMPLKLGDGSLFLPKPQPWTIDIRTGETSTVPDAPR